MSDAKYSQAYTYLSVHYKQTVTNPSQLPNQLPGFGKIAGCTEFGGGFFLQISGDHATDSMQFMFTGGQAGNATIPGQLGLVKAGSSWQIDSIGL